MKRCLQEAEVVWGRWAISGSPFVQDMEKQGGYV